MVRGGSVSCSCLTRLMASGGVKRDIRTRVFVCTYEMLKRSHSGRGSRDPCPGCEKMTEKPVVLSNVLSSHSGGGWTYIQDVLPKGQRVATRDTWYYTSHHTCHPAQSNRFTISESVSPMTPLSESVNAQRRRQPHPWSSSCCGPRSWLGIAVGGMYIFPPSWWVVPYVVQPMLLL